MLLFIMSFKDKLNKIKNKIKDSKSVLSLDYLDDNEKTGVITGLVLLGAATGYLLSHSPEAEASTCVDNYNNNVGLSGKSIHHSGWDNWGNWGRWCRWSKWSRHSNNNWGLS